MSTTHLLPDLPCEPDALEPHISRETLSFHSGKHHAAHVKKLNRLIHGTGFAGQTLEDIVQHAKGDVFNNAARACNHEFYWHSLSPKGGGAPQAAIGEAIRRDFDSFERCGEQFSEAAAGLFGSGWAWLVLNDDDTLQIVTTTNADTPLREGLTPLLAGDVREHAYDPDYRSRRADYIEAFRSLVNREFAGRRLLSIRPQEPRRSARH